jgi:hypothetical protein
MTETCGNCVTSPALLLVALIVRARRLRIWQSSSLSSLAASKHMSASHVQHLYLLVS